MQAAAWMVQLPRPQPRGNGSSLLGFHPRGVANSTCWPCGVIPTPTTDRLRRRRAGRLRPGRRGAHRESYQGVRATLRGQEGPGLPRPPSARPISPRTSTRCEVRWLTPPPRFLLRLPPPLRCEAYPQNVRACPSHARWTQTRIRSRRTCDRAGFQRAFNDYAADCAESADRPPGTDPAKAVDISRQPSPPARPEACAFPTAVVCPTATRSLGTTPTLYSPHGWRHLTGANELKVGRGDALLTLADLYTAPMRRVTTTTPSTYGWQSTALTNRRSTNPAKVVEACPRLREGCAVHRRPASSPGTPCWGPARSGVVPPASTPQPISVQGLPPALLVSTTHDPAAPYQARRRSCPPTRWQAAHLRGHPAHSWCCRATPASTTSPRAIWSTSHCRRQTLDAESALRSRYKFDLAKGWRVAPERARRPVCVHAQHRYGSNSAMTRPLRSGSNFRQGLSWYGGADCSADGRWWLSCREGSTTVVDLASDG